MAREYWRVWMGVKYVRAVSRLDELIAPIAPERRAAVVARLQGPFVIQTIRAWLAGEEIDACWLLADWCRREIASLPRFGWSDARHMATISATSLLLERLGRHADAPTVWLELVAAVPSYKPMIGRGIVEAMMDDAWTYPSIRRALATSTIPHRRLLATRLQRSGTLDADLAVTWLADPTLRPLAETFLAPGLEAHEQLLRDRLEDAKPSEREAIVRLLRRVDPRLSLTGTHDTSTDGELQARLRENPVDEVTAEVWADSLIDRQDARGEVIALELALRRADPERALELSGTLATFVAANRKALWNKPGGFPYREKYRGRTIIAFGSDW